MADEDPRDRFRQSGETYKESLENPEEQETKDVLESQEEQEETDIQEKGDIRQRRESFQAYVPPEDKEAVESTWRKIKVLCNLVEQAEPKKNDFYTAVLRVGYRDLEAIASELDLSEAFAQHREIIE